MQFQINKRGGQAPQVQPEFTIVGDKIIGSTTWTTEGRRRERYQVVTIRDGKIIDIQGCTSRREAERVARRSQIRP